MRRHFSLKRFSLPRLAIVVVWAALSPQCALLVNSWTGLLPGATVSDAAGVVPDFVGSSNRSSERPGTVATLTHTKPPYIKSVDHRLTQPDRANHSLPTTAVATHQFASGLEIEARHNPQL